MSDHSSPSVVVDSPPPNVFELVSSFFIKRKTVKKKSSAALLLVLTSYVGACGGPPEITPQLAAQDSALTEEVRSTQKHQDQFTIEADALIRDIQAFRGQHGWNELAPILKNSKTASSQASALKVWGEKWKQAPNTVSQRFQQLVERSSAIEKRRKELVATWKGIKTKEDDLLRNSGRFKAREMDKAVSVQTLNYDIYRMNLSRYEVDELGLLQRLDQATPGR